MDLNTIKEIREPATLAAAGPWKDGHAWLAGGTWLFSEPQIATDTLVDLQSLNWPAITSSPEGLEIGATCKIAELADFDFPPEWKAGSLFRECCEALLASFKIWNEATVGGNICMSLPAGSMISLTTALEGVYTLNALTGESRDVIAIDFVTGNHSNILSAGELLRSIRLPASALAKQFVFRRASLTQVGRSAVLLIGTRCPEIGKFLLTITAATERPVQVGFPTIPTADELASAIQAAVPETLWFNDVHGSPAYRRHLTYYFAEEIRTELGNR